MFWNKSMELKNSKGTGHRGVWIGGGIIAGLLYVSAFTGILPGNAMRMLVQIFLYIVLGESWNLLSGYAGMTSLGQQLYIGLAGYTVAVAADYRHLPLLPCLMCAAVVCVAAAAAFSCVLFRMRGMYFAVATWVCAEAMGKLFLSWKYVNQGGGMTITFSPYPQSKELYFASLTLCIAMLVLIYRILRSRLGLALMALRDNPDTAAVIGISVIRAKLAVYLTAALGAALAGGLFFVSKGMIYPDSGFHVSWTVSAVFICIIGGTGTLTGPVCGAFVYVLLREYLAHYPGWSNIILGLITILVILFFPKGIIGTIESVRKNPFIPERRMPPEL